MGVGFMCKEDKLTAFLEGEIDHHTAGALREAVDAKAGQIKPRELRLDFSHITFMDSSGIGLILGRYRLMEALGGLLVVCGLSPQMERIVSLSGIGRLVVLEQQPEVFVEEEEGETPESEREIYSHSNKKKRKGGKRK